LRATATSHTAASPAAAVAGKRAPTVARHASIVGARLRATAISHIAASRRSRGRPQAGSYGRTATTDVPRATPPPGLPSVIPRE